MPTQALVSVQPQIRHRPGAPGRVIDVIGDRDAQAAALVLAREDAGGIERGEGRLKQQREALIGSAASSSSVAVKHVAGQRGRGAAGGDRGAKHEQPRRVGDAPPGLTTASAGSSQSSRTRPPRR
jgi:hypothetical protein